MPINERAIEREEQFLEDQLVDGSITQDEYNKEMRELQRDIQGEYERDRENALRQVDDEWGVW